MITEIITITNGEEEKFSFDESPTMSDEDKAIIKKEIKLIKELLNIDISFPTLDEKLTEREKIVRPEIDRIKKRYDMGN